MRLQLSLIAAGLAVVASTSTGCVGTIRDTTTPRTATEMLLISTATERALAKYETKHLKGRKVFIDDSKFESVDKSYVVSALRDKLSGDGVRLVDAVAPVEGDKNTGADRVVEIRNASLGIWDGDFVLGIPQLPFAAQGLPATLLPPLYVFRRFSQEGWAKLQFWTYDPKTRRHLHRSADLWGNAYYNQWWVLGVGPFDSSNDIYPEEGILDAVTGTNGDGGGDED